MPISEREFQRDVIKAARARGWRVYFHWSSLHSPAGWVDLILLHPDGGRALFRELKSDRGYLRQNQRECLAALRMCGLDAGVWRPRDWDAIIAALDGKAMPSSEAALKTPPKRPRKAKRGAMQAVSPAPAPMALPGGGAFAYAPRADVIGVCADCGADGRYLTDSGVCIAAIDCKGEGDA